MIKRRRFSEDIADSVLDKVIEMGLQEGDRLPTHSQLSEMLGISLPSLREGLSLLSLSGVINITHGAGTTLANPGPDDYFKMLTPVSRISRVNMAELSNFCTLFIPDLVTLIQKTPDRYNEKLGVLIQIGRDDSRKEFMDVHRKFHIYLASDMENQLKKETFLIALNLFYTQLEVLNISRQDHQLYFNSHILLNKSIQSGNKKKITEALKECYNFQTHIEDKISILYNSFGTGSLGGSFYSMAKKFRNILIGEENIDIHLELTGGGIENITLTEEGKTILALTQSDIAEAAYRGKGIFSKEHTHLRVVCSVKPLDLWIVSLKNKNITNLYDLKGRRIAMGAEGGDSGIVARTIFQDLGFESGDYRPFYLSLSNALQGLSSNEIDVVFFLAHDIPLAVKDLSEKEDHEFISIPSEIISSLENENPLWKASAIQNNNTDINTISVATVLITGSSVSENLICRIATILKEKSDSSDQVSFNIPSNNISIPFHTGVLECLK